MASAGQYVGSSWYGTWITSGGTFVLSGNQTMFGTERTVDTVEVTAGSDTQKAYLPTVTDNKFSYAYYDAGTAAAAGTALAAQLKPNTSGTITFGPQGTATGKPKYQIAAVVTSQKIEYAFDAAALFEVEFLGSGSWVLDHGSAW